MAAYTRVSSPYATTADMPVFQKRSNAAVAPWLRDEPAILSSRSHDPDAFMSCNSQTAPFATFHNVPRSLENNGVVEDAPWDKNLPALLPGRGSGVHEHSLLPSSQTAPFATNENFEEQKQYEGPMPDAPWDKDQRPAY